MALARCSVTPFTSSWPGLSRPSTPLNGACLWEGPPVARVSNWNVHAARSPGVVHWLLGDDFAREAFELKDARSAPPSAAARRAVLDFEGLSRSAPPSKQ